MIDDPQKETEAYIKSHGLRQLFEDMTSHLIFYKPDDPFGALVKFLEKSRDIGPEMLLNQQDLEAMFGMFDVTRKGTVTMRQAREALKTVLGPEADFPVDLDADDDTLLKVGDFVSKMSGALHASMPETRGK